MNGSNNVQLLQAKIFVKAGHCYFRLFVP